MRRSVGSFRYAIAGLWYLVYTQPNARVHLVIACAAVGLGILLRLPNAELALLALAIGLVIMAEAMNSAVEALVDFVQPDRHPTAGVVKDLAAAGVLIASISSAAVGLLLFIPRLLP